MPKVYNPPIMLSKEKILAVLAYLQSLGGEENIEEIMQFADLIPDAGSGEQENLGFRRLLQMLQLGKNYFLILMGLLVVLNAIQ